VQTKKAWFWRGAGGGHSPNQHEESRMLSNWEEPWLVHEIKNFSFWRNLTKRQQSAVAFFPLSDTAPQSWWRIIDEMAGIFGPPQRCAVPTR